MMTSSPGASWRRRLTVLVHVDVLNSCGRFIFGIKLTAGFRREMSVTEMFSYIQGFLSADQDIREVSTNSTALAHRDC